MCRQSLHHTLPVFLALFLAATLPAAALPGYAISATSVRMPESGLGASQYTVTGIPMTGTLNIACAYSGPSTPAHIPTCTYGPVVAYSVTAGQTFTGTVFFYPYGSAIPLSQHRERHLPPAALALAGGLLLGLCRRRGLLRSLLLVFCALVAFAALSGCIAGVSDMTAGQYQYTITATNTPQNSAAPVSAATTITVSIP